MREILVNDALNEITNHISLQKEEVIYIVHKTPIVFASKSNDVNLSECQKLNLSIINSNNYGGTILSFKGDIDLGIFMNYSKNIGPKFLDEFKIKLSDKISNLDIIGNDLLVDNKYKIASYANTKVKDNFYYTCIHISMNPDIEVIRRICTKSMLKIPKGLKDYGYTTESIISNIQDIIKI